MKWFAEMGRIDAEQVGIPVLSVDPNTTLANVMYTVYMWAGILAVLIIIIAGFFLTLSDGDVARVTRARKTIISAGVGLVVVLGAFVITRFILGAL